jgi:hypothetical protein
MRILIYTVIGVMASILARADTDYTCVNQCTAQGNQYMLCVNKCSYSQPSGLSNVSGGGTYTPPKQTDYGCVNRCTAQGFMYNLCLDRCSY